ncbi:PIN domain-containing protein [Persephonella sp. IF05-L8]|uniref:PIN domain-containing protein n=1 Tax=Persephonella sp. IF05-L8 TaxID=1158338 RepID=UPI000497BFE5
MNKSFFVDSNIFIESFKQNYQKEAKDILNIIFSDKNNDYYINELVFDEVYFHLIIKNKIRNSYKEELLFELLNLFSFLESKKEIIQIARNYIVNFRLRTHDALILATVKFYEVNFLISFDSDFVDIAAKENIKIVSNAAKLKKF